jgi:hypothetical protein
VPRESEGRPDFRYVATHICDSVKRRLKADGTAGLQGEFGIGLLSFWTVGNELTMTSTGTDQRAYQMVMRKGDPSFSVSSKRTLFGEGGTEVRIAPLLDGIRALSGEKIQWYLAAELRDRIRVTGVRINVVDKMAHKQYAVEPRQYEGRLLHRLPLLRTPLGDIYVELFLNEPADTNCVALYRRGTRVIDDLTLLDHFARAPWNLRYLQGHLDASFVNLTPGTRAGIIYDTSYITLCGAPQPLEPSWSRSSRRSAAPGKSRRVGNSCVASNARSERLLALPAEEYDWFDIHARAFRPSPKAQRAPTGACHRTHSWNHYPGLRSRAKTSDDGSSSNSPGPCLAWRFHRYRASCGLAPRRSCERSRETARGFVSRRTWSFIGSWSKALARSSGYTITRSRS